MAAILKTIKQPYVGNDLTDCHEFGMIWHCPNELYDAAHTLYLPFNGQPNKNEKLLLKWLQFLCYKSHCFKSANI